MDTKSHYLSWTWLQNMVALEMGGFCNKTTKMSFSLKPVKKQKNWGLLVLFKCRSTINNQQLSNSHMDACDQKVKVKLQIHQK